MKNISKQVEEFAKENGLSEEINQAYIDNVGEEYANANDIQETYAGNFDSDEEFAQDMYDQTKTTNSDQDNEWPYYCIDWNYAARELMIDYFESNGHYFRNL